MSDFNEETQPNPPRRGIKKGIYIIPSAFTIGNILCGFYAVINSAKGYQLLDQAGQIAQATHLFDNASRAIGIAFLLDGLDGRIARMTKATSDFGVELDSIADVLTFGIAPAVMAYTWGYGSTPGLERIAWGVSFFFLICGALRLARFNVMARAPRFSDPGKSPKLDKKSFVGLPIPAAASMLAAVIHFVPRPLPTLKTDQQELYSWFLIVGMSALAVLMVSTFRYTSFKNLGLKSNKPFITLPLLSLLLAGIWFYSQWVLLILVTGYVSHGPIFKLWNLISRPFRRTSSTEEPSTSVPVE
ncbi:MAG TPA: CDP-diacylglycerol--serine O-phosphatidyltransferase [Blastocatellia bacterium]|nr:CDP-diacylglycerol--serine O-phosphatidyltransferase [Blastocatellia bacterium]